MVKTRPAAFAHLSRLALPLLVVTACGGGGKGGGGDAPVDPAGNADGRPGGKLTPTAFSSLQELVDQVAPGFAADALGHADLAERVEAAAAVLASAPYLRFETPGLGYIHDHIPGQAPKPAPGVGCGSLTNLLLIAGRPDSRLDTPDLAFHDRFGGPSDESVAFASNVRINSYKRASYKGRTWTERRFVGAAGRRVLLAYDETGPGETETLDFSRCATLVDLDARTQTLACSSFSDSDIGYWSGGVAKVQRTFTDGLFTSRIDETRGGTNWRNDIVVEAEQTGPGASRYVHTRRSVNGAGSPTTSKDEATLEHRKDSCTITTFTES